MPPQTHAGVEEGDRPGAAFDPVLMKRLWTFIRPHQRWLWMGLGCLLLMSASRLTMPWLVKLALDDHLSIGDLQGYYPLVLLFLAVALVDAGLRRLQQVLVETGGQGALRDLRIAIFRHLQRLSASFFDRTPTGRLVGRVTTDVEALQELFASGVVTIAGDLLFLVDHRHPLRPRPRPGCGVDAGGAGSGRPHADDSHSCARRLRTHARAPVGDERFSA